MDQLVDSTLARQKVELGLTDLIEHRVELTDSTPIRHKFRRMSPRMIEIATEEINKLAGQGAIERSASNYNSAPVLVRKSDGRDLNKKTKRDSGISKLYIVKGRFSIFPTHYRECMRRMQTRR